MKWSKPTTEDLIRSASVRLVPGTVGARARLSCRAELDRWHAARQGRYSWEPWKEG